MFSEHILVYMDDINVLRTHFGIYGRYYYLQCNVLRTHFGMTILLFAV